MPSSLVAGLTRGLLNVTQKLTLREGAVLVLSGSATAPANPVEGTIWYDSANNALKFYNGTAWLTVTAA